MKKLLLLIPYAKTQTARSLELPTLDTKQVENKRLENFKNTFVIRWGNSLMLGDKFGIQREFSDVVNSAEAIWFNCEKMKARRAMGENVKIPTFYDRVVPIGKKAVVRPYTHAHGSEFKIVTGPFEIPFGYYASEFVQTPTEYRVWFAYGKTFAGQRVSLGEEHEKQFPCRSKWGYSYRDVPPKLHRDTLAAANRIGLTFGAADVLVKGNQYYFLELNSAPSIDAPTPRRFFRDNILRCAADNGVDVSQFSFTY